MQTTQVFFAPISHQYYGDIQFQGSKLNTPSLATNLNVSNTSTLSSIVFGTTYNFHFNGCYQ